jgi:hypothetical protein
LGISLVFVLSGTIAIVIGGVLGRVRTGMQPPLLRQPVDRKRP